MKNLKKALSLTLALALSLALALPAGAAGVEDYQYIKFSKEPNSSAQVTIACNEGDRAFDVSFTLWVFSDDTSYTVTIPDGGSVSYEFRGYHTFEDGSAGIGIGDNYVRAYFGEEDAPRKSGTLYVTGDEGVQKVSIYDSVEYDDYGYVDDVAGELLEEIYICAQSIFDPLVAEGIAVVEQAAEPEQPTTPAEPEQPSTPAAPSGISVTVGGNAVVWTDAAPFIDANSRTMVPLRAVADAMDLTVNWDGDARVASFTDGGKTISFPIDSNTASTSDGGSVEMDTAAVIANERTYAPIRYLAEFFGYTVGWDGAAQTVSLTK